MQILLHADTHTDGSAAMTEHLQQAVREALRRFGERVLRVEAHLSDDNGKARTGVDDIQCTLQAALKDGEPVVVKDRANNAHQAIAGALRKLTRAVGTAVAKHDPRNQHAAAPPPLP